MGRKIPGKKHHGVKDPAAQKLRRELILKDKINAPPTRPDFQEIPKTVLELNRLRNLAKNSLSGPKKKTGKKRMKGKFVDLNRLSGAGPQLPGMKQVDKNMPSLQQRTGETELSFMSRVENAASELIEEVAMESRHSVQVNRHASGKIDGVKKMKRTKNGELGAKGQQSNLVQPQKNNQKNKASKKKSASEAVEVRPKLTGVLSDEEEEEASKKIKLDTWYENIPFGEVAHAPPKITKLPRRAAQIEKKPVSDGLLLTQMLKPSTGVSTAAKQQQERLRLDVVEAYRRLKASKRKPFS